MSPVEQRIVELSIIGKLRPLTEMEAREWEESRQFIANREWKIAKVFNLMYAARVIKDWQWFSELGMEYKRLMGR